MKHGGSGRARRLNRSSLATAGAAASTGLRGGREGIRAVLFRVDHAACLVRSYHVIVFLAIAQVDAYLLPTVSGGRVEEGGGDHSLNLILVLIFTARRNRSFI